MSRTSDRKAMGDTLTCPGCLREFGRKQIGGHKTHCLGLIGPPIWSRARPTWGSRGFIYLVETTEGPARVKVGFTGGELRSRLKTLLSGSPVELRVRAAWPGCRGVEWDLHRLVRPYWVRGEWFEDAAAVIVEEYMDRQKVRAA